MTYWRYEETYYARLPHESRIVCAGSASEVFILKGYIKCTPWISDGVGASPLELVMRELLAVRRKETGNTTKASIDERMEDIEGIEWLEDRVVFYVNDWINYGGRKRGPPIPSGYFITYPHTTVGECMACGAPCDVYVGCCSRCKPILIEVMKEVKQNVEIIEDIKASEKIISEFKGKLNERYRPAKSKTTRALVKV